MTGNQRIETPLPYVDPLYPTIQRWENGLVLYNEFITEEEEAIMIDAILKDDRWAGPGKRKVLHFGSHFDYTTFAASETLNTPLPAFLSDLLPRLPIQEYLPDQFTAQYYPPGTGIPPHVDTHSAFRECIYSLSLGSCIPIYFQRCGQRAARRVQLPRRSLHDTSNDPQTSVPRPVDLESTAQMKDLEGWELFLPRRSLLLMTGPSRYGYTHKIRGRKFDQREGLTVAREGRYSVTMRTVKRGKEIGCDCEFSEVCDARVREQSQDIVN
jgi:alkylated DNA repair protein alkB family protein 8